MKITETFTTAKRKYFASLKKAEKKKTGLQFFFLNAINIYNKIIKSTNK